MNKDSFGLENDEKKNRTIGWFRNFINLLALHHN